MDEQIGILLDRLRSKPELWEKTAVLIVADHGEGLNQHGYQQHGGTWNEQVHVPLIMRVPGGRMKMPARDSTLLGMSDVMPTFLARMGATWGKPLVQQASGTDVMAAGFKTRPVLSQKTGRDCPNLPSAPFVWTDWPWRLHRDPKGGDKLFNLQSDPHELKNVLSENGELGKRLRFDLQRRIDLLKRRGAELRAKAPPASGPADAKRDAELEALGYVGGSDEEEPEDRPHSRPTSGSANP